MKKQLALTMLISMFLFSAYSQTKISEFWNLMDSKEETKNEKIEEYLKDWKSQDKKDPELYTAYFNYYLDRAITEEMHVENEKPSSGDYLTGKNDNGDTVYIYSEITFDEKYTMLAFSAVDKGLSYNPDRLDLYWGKSQLLFMTEKYSDQIKLIEKVLNQNKKGGNKWLWSENNSIDKYSITIEKSLHEYITNYLNSKEESIYPYAKELSALFVKYFPESTIAYNDAGLCSIYNNEIKEAKEYYKKGWLINKADLILLANLSITCEKLNEKDEALEYLSILRTSGIKEYEDFAEKRIKVINNQ